jgi:hypothetical protein
MNPITSFYEIVIATCETMEKYIQKLETRMLAKYPKLITYKPLGVKA